MLGEPVQINEDIEFIMSTRIHRGGVPLAVTVESARRVVAIYQKTLSELENLQKLTAAQQKDISQLSEDLILSKKLLEESRKIIALHRGV